jgi:hypothetical protein
MTSEEDEAWEHVQRIESLNRKRQIEKSKTSQEFYDELRNNVIEEVAQHIEKLTGFGNDTVDGLTIYIRGLKK